MPLSWKADILLACKNEKSRNVSEHKRYRSLVGSILCLSIWTRPVASFRVSVLARQGHEPTKRHIALVKKIMCYAAGRLTTVLPYPYWFQTTPKAIRAHFTPIGQNVKKPKNQFLDGLLLKMVHQLFKKRRIKLHEHSHQENQIKSLCLTAWSYYGGWVRLSCSGSKCSLAKKRS